MAENETQGERALPDGWVWTTVGEVTQPIEKVKPRENPDAPFTYLDISSIDNKSFRIAEPKAYYGAEAPSRARQLVQANDVLFSTVRTYLKNIALVPAAYDGQIASTGFSVLRGEPAVSSKYLFYYTLTDRFVNEIGKLQRGTSYPAVRDGDVRAQPIPLASFPEQRRIVAEIETHFTRLDAGVAALERAQANLRRYKASVLKAACEGRLVPTEASLARAENRDYEPADQLLARILTERRARWEADYLEKQRAKSKEPKNDKWKQKYKKPALSDTESLPDLPEGWIWATVQQVGNIGEQPVLTGPFGSNLGRADFIDLGVPVLTIGCLTEQGITLNKAFYISEDKASELKRYRIRAGDLLFSRMASVGRAGLVPVRLEGAIINYHLMRLRLADTVIDPNYFIAYVRGSDTVVDYIREVNHGATRDGINTNQLLNMPIALPPLAEQHRIVAEVERRLSVVTALGASVEAALARARRLRQAVLKQAFEGRLVEQHPDDEPASVLLERIRAEKAQREAEGKTSRKKQRKRNS